jgi:hypothetical protein
MLRPRRTQEFLIALFLLGALLLVPPLLIIFSKPVRVFGIPSLYLYLFAVWTGLIALVAVAIERRSPQQDPSEAGAELPARENTGGPGDA